MFIGIQLLNSHILLIKIVILLNMAIFGYAYEPITSE